MSLKNSKSTRYFYNVTLTSNKYNAFIAAGSGSIDYVDGIGGEGNSLHERMFRNINTSSEEQILVTASPSCVEAALTMRSLDDTTLNDPNIRLNKGYIQENSDIHSTSNSKRRKISTSPLLPVQRYCKMEYRMRRNIFQQKALFKKAVTMKLSSI